MLTALPEKLLTAGWKKFLPCDGKNIIPRTQSSLEAMCEVMDEVKKPPDEKLVIKSDVLRKYFPKSYTPQQMEAVIMKLLEQWMKKRIREQER